MKCKAVFRPPQIDIDAYRQKLKKHMTEEVSYLLYRWLEAVLNELPIDGAKMPVWSGASRATFLKLARHIEYGIPISPVVASREAEGQAKSLGSLNLNDKGDGRYTFSYTTTLPWLVTNEYFDARQWGIRLKHPGPYHFQETGANVFAELAKDVKLPPVVTKIKPITVG